MARAGYTFALLLVAGCSDPEGGFESFGAAGLQYHRRVDDLSVGPSVLQQLERYGAAADALLGLSPTDHLPVAYYKYRDLRDYQEHGPCRADSAGCEFQRSEVLEVHSPLSADEHELTHAYTAAIGAPPNFLLEGIASSVSCYPGVEDRFVAGQRPSWLEQTWGESPFQVCGTCSGGELGECSTVAGGFVADGPAEPWLRVHWNAQNNGVLVLAVSWHV